MDDYCLDCSTAHIERIATTIRYHHPDANTHCIRLEFGINYDYCCNEIPLCAPCAYGWDEDDESA